MHGLVGSQNINFFIKHSAISDLGTVDRLGRALVVTESHLPEDGWNEDEIIKVLSCYYTITRCVTQHM